MSFDVGGGSASAPAPVLAVVIESGRLVAGMVGADGNVVVRDRVAIPTRDVWVALERLIGRVRAAAPDELPPPRAIGVTCSGPIDIRAGSVSPPFVAAWSGFPLRTRLQEFCGVPAVLDSAAGAAAAARLAHRTEGAPESFLEVLLGPVVDTACVIAGRLMQGDHGNAGSLAHVTVDPGGRTCWCGSEGCLEALASTAAIEADIGRPLQRANASIVSRTGLMVGRAIVSFAAIADVATVYVSGHVVEVLGPAMMESLRTEVAARARLTSIAGMQVIESPPPANALVAAALRAAVDLPAVGAAGDPN